MNQLDGYDAVAGPAGWGIASSEARSWVMDALGRGHKLRDVAARDPGALLMRGRGPVYAVPVQGRRWVVRPYRRGGRVAGPLLGDRYLRLGEPRPLREARMSAEIARRGIPTPPVMAGVVYPVGSFYRADLVTAYISDSRDLTALLFGNAAGRGPTRLRALEEAGRLIGRMARAGVEHADMNARNVLLAAEGNTLRAMVLDLDRCNVHEPGRSSPPSGMLLRLERSLRKVATESGGKLSEADWNALRDAVEADG